MRFADGRSCARYAHRVPSKQMDFKDFIEREGPAKIAAVMGVSLYTVKCWRYRQRRPRPEQAPKLIEYANGALTWQDIYPGGAA